MIKELLSIFLTSVTALGLIACTRTDPKTAPVSEKVEVEKKSFEGVLDKKLHEIYFENPQYWSEPCDFDNRDKILEVGKALEARREEIAKLSVSSADPSKVEFVQFGPFQFRKQLQRDQPKDEWVRYDSSWKEYIEYYESIKSEPTNGRWVYLNTNVRAIIVDDEKRLTGGFMGVTQASVPTLLAIKEIIFACEADVNCGNPPLSEQQRSYLNNSGVFRFYWKKLDDPNYALEKRRKDIESLKLEISEAAERLATYPYKAIRREGNTLVVPMDMSAFGEATAQAIEEMTAPWNQNSDYKIRIEPIQKTEATYKVEVSEQVGNRPFVHRGKLLMQLYNQGVLAALPHEFGHILGFRDTYYTSWDKEKCAYKDEVNLGDIMSDSSSGVVLQSHWDDLKRLYFQSPTE